MNILKISKYLENQIKSDYYSEDILLFDLDLDWCFFNEVSF